MLRSFRDAEGRSSYDVIADEVSGMPRQACLLDLACGDGYLLELLAGRDFERLVGIDRSAEEIEAAKLRLGPGVELHCQDASALPLPDGSMDAVLCHMALMLMDPVEPVLGEISRVLAPGGRLLAVINRRHPDPACEVFSRELRRVTLEAGLERLRLGPPDIYTTAGLRALLSRSALDETQASIQDFVVGVRATPPELWTLFEAMYDVFRLPEPSQAALARALLDAWGALADDRGELGAEMGMRLLVCPARDARSSS